jgi:hypothetical protein
MTDMDVDLTFDAVSMTQMWAIGSAARYAREGHPERPFRPWEGCP